MARIAAAHPDLELLAPSRPDAVLNVVVFRYAPRDVPEPARNRVNAEILMQLHERGIAVPTTGRVGDRGGIRVAVTNHRSRRDDFEALAAAVVAIGAEVTARTARA